MKTLNIGVLILLAISISLISTSATNGKPEKNKAGDLKNPSIRIEKAERLHQESINKRNAAWTAAQKKGWKIKGQAEGALFELTAIEHNRPIYKITQNYNAAITTAANLVRNTEPYNLNGSGLTVGVWDAGSVLSMHQEFGTRVDVMDGAASYWHSTHVGGTIGAVGIQPAAMGMAPSVDIDSYDWDSDTSEMLSRGASYAEEPGKIYISSHSYGIITGWTIGDYSGEYGPHWFGVWGYREDEGFGQYDTEAATWDTICYEAPYYLPFRAAGNDRADSAPNNGDTFYYYDGGTWHSKSYDNSTDPYSDGWDNGGFDTISYNGTAKNIMTVGAVSDAVKINERYLPYAFMTGFSSWGPTDDGRIKPDIVANGTELYSAIDTSNTSYATYSGTSMSTPNASGSAVLLAQLYCQFFPGQAMRASTLKGLIIHTDDDLGNPGPDYSFGWGLMNTKAAADQIIDHNNYPSENKIVEAILSAENPTDSYTFIWNGDTAIKATLCWTDPPAGALTGLDNPAPRLINDLDLRILDPNGLVVYYPYILDRLNPANAATTGDNTCDNVEQVYISSPNSPGIYTVQVSHKGTLTDGQQHYSLIISGQYHIPGPRGTIKMDKTTYSCSDLVKIELQDGDLADSNSHDVLISTTGTDTETVTLYEDDFRKGIFMGSITTSTGTAVPGDNILQVADGQTITASYQDANDGNGGLAESSYVALVDCRAPVILNLEVSGITSSAATISFETNEPATAYVSYGIQCDDLNTNLEDPLMSTEHIFQIATLTPETKYYFAITASDNVNNVTVDDNEGFCHQFTTVSELNGIHVPGDYNTIQEAINAANNGDTVIVADGTYTGPGNIDIDFLGKAITVTSENGPINCIIDCQASLDNPHRGFYFHNGETNNSVLSGFTIINGFGLKQKVIHGHIGSIFHTGGAILCDKSSPIIENCVFRNNIAEDYSYYNFGCGGAIACTSSNALISDCTFENNSAYYGAGLYAEEKSIKVTGCIFRGNSAYYGGGLEGYECDLQVEDCIISGNFSNGSGAGIYCDGLGKTESVIINCVISDNVAYKSGMGSATGGGIESSDNNIRVVNCTIVNNMAVDFGGGIDGGENVTNCIIRGNSPDQVAYSGNVTYNNIQGGYTGQGNIDKNPCFVSASDFHLTVGSPCIDAGTNSALIGFPPTDFDGKPRPLDGDANLTNIADMGAYEFWNQPSGPFIAINVNCINLFAFEDTNVSRIFSLKNGWTGTLNWQITESADWLTVSPAYGSSAGEINEITITADSRGLTKGYYYCDLIISDQNAVNNPQIIPIRIRVGGLLVPQEYPTIQAAIDAALEADVVQVADGTYTGSGNYNIDFEGKAITVMSQNGPLGSIIDCQGTGPAFNFRGNETNSSILDGFTIQNAVGPGVICDGSSPTITNCIIINCFNSYRGGGIYFYNSAGKLINTLITRCSAGDHGGAIYSEGGYQGSYPQIINCTIADNSAPGSGSGYSCWTAGSITNSIFWGNDISPPSSYFGVLTVSYSDIQGGFSGTGNINLDPCFVNAAGGDYHISVNSPCINSGDPDFSGFAETDIDGNPRVINGRIDMGIDEFDYESPIIGISPEQIRFTASLGSPNPPPQILSIYNIGCGTLNWEITENCSWLQANPTTGTSNGEANQVTLSVDITGLGEGAHSCELTVTGNGVNAPRKVKVYLIIGNTINVPSDFSTIQQAINVASNGMVIVISPGTYTGQGNRDLDFAGKVITVQSTNPYDPAVVAATVIDCQGSSSVLHRAFYFHSGESTNSIVSGLTIINGYISGANNGYGGGIYCKNSSPTIKYCVFRNNYADENGGGISLRTSNSTISHCTFTANISWAFLGGGLACESPGNAIIKHCVFVGNGPSTGGGIGVRYSSAQIEHCILWGNTGYGGAGQIHLSDAALTVEYSDIQGGQTGISQQGTNTINWGAGNIDIIPNFMDMANGDYHLQSNSWCINAGNLNYVPQPGETDIDGQPRIMGCRIDIGADEFELNVKQTDFTMDCAIDLDDLGIFAEAWLSQTGNQNWNANCDLSVDGQIDLQDFAGFAKDWLSDFSLIFLPEPATDPIPPNGMTDVSIITDLGWTAGNNTTSHDVYFGTNPSPGAGEFKIEKTGTTYDPGTLSYSTTYYWRIDEKNIAGTTTGDVWSFTTWAEPNLWFALAAWWKFDEGTGTIAHDSAGTNNGTVYGATWTTGKIAGALNFDGTNDYVDCGSGPSNYDNITVSAWMKTSINGPLVSNRYDSPDGGTWYTLSARSIEIGNYSPGSSMQLAFTKPTLNNAWHHVVYMKNGINHAIYIDGGPDKSFTSDSDISQAQPLFIGRSGTINIDWFNGVIDDVRIYDRALSREEIVLLYRQGL